MRFFFLPTKFRASREAHGKMVENGPRCGAKVDGAGLEQLLAAAIAIEHADAVDAVLFSPDNVVAAVADHDRARGIGTGAFERPGEQVALVDAGAVKLGAEHIFKIRAQAKV